MHAIVKQPDGTYYISAVFGCYCAATAPGAFFNPYYIVWDAEKKRLIKRLELVPQSRYSNPQVLIIDADHADWTMNEDGEGCVNFLSRQQLDDLFALAEQPEDVLARCRRMDEGYVYNEQPEIRSEADIENLMWATGGFHDARIDEKRELDDGTLYLRIGGIWGCNIEVWLWGDVKYDPLNIIDYTPCWFGGTILLRDGFVYLFDEQDMTPEQLRPGDAWFRARHMKYRIIPVWDGMSS